jgi:hypothetical protein
MALETTPKFGVLVVPATCQWLPSRRPSIRWLRRPTGEDYRYERRGCVGERCHAWFSASTGIDAHACDVFDHIPHWTCSNSTSSNWYAFPLLSIPHRCCLFLGLLPAEWGGWCSVHQLPWCAGRQRSRCVITPTRNFLMPFPYSYRFYWEKKKVPSSFIRCLDCCTYESSVNILGCLHRSYCFICSRLLPGNEVLPQHYIFPCYR